MLVDGFAGVRCLLTMLMGALSASMVAQEH